jgi:hypothetical protein
LIVNNLLVKWRNHQSTTSWAFQHEYKYKNKIIKGIYLNADRDYYVVLPPDKKNVATIGDLALVVDLKTGKYVIAIVGDSGHDGNFRELSWSIYNYFGYVNEKAQFKRGVTFTLSLTIFPKNIQGKRAQLHHKRRNADGGAGNCRKLKIRNCRRGHKRF